MGINVNLHGTTCAETCYIAARRILETKTEAVLVCTQQLGRGGGSNFGMVSIKVFAP